MHMFYPLLDLLRSEAELWSVAPFFPTEYFGRKVDKLWESIAVAHQKRLLVKSLPMCWDTPRAGTNEGYFDFQHFAFCAHVRNLKEIVISLY